MWTPFDSSRDDPEKYDRTVLAALATAQGHRAEGIDLGGLEFGAHRMATAFLACACALGVPAADARELWPRTSGNGYGRSSF